VKNPGRGIAVLQPTDAVPCPLLRAGTMSAKTCALRQHARANGSPIGPRYYPCSYLMKSGIRSEIEFRCDVGRDALRSMGPEWQPGRFKHRHSDPKLVRLHAVARRKWIETHLPIDRIDGKMV
jgi:hypothetical protein